MNKKNGEKQVKENFIFKNAYQYWLMDHYDQTELYYKGRICLNHTASEKNSCQIN